MVSPTFKPSTSAMFYSTRSIVSSSFLLIVALLLIFLIIPTLIPPRIQPISLPDELDDLMLFHRASLPPNPGPSSFSRVSKPTPHPKIAFLFLTNSDLHFSPLWLKFFNNSSRNLFNLYVHADPSTRFTTPIPTLFKQAFIASKKTQRGSPSLVSAARRLLATAILHDPNNFFFALLSQHCVPLHSFQFFYHSVFSPQRFSSPRFGADKYRSFIEIIDEDPNMERRYRARGDNVMMPEVPFEKFRAGSQFFVLKRPHALLVIKDRKLWKKFRLPCIHIESCYPEEHYFPTLLSMEDPQGCTNFTLTRVNWTDSVGGHPHTYRPEQVSPELIYRLRVSNSSYSYMFARKFSPDCLHPLMEIADDVIFQD